MQRLNLILTLLFLSLTAVRADGLYADHLEPEYGPFVYGRFAQGYNENLSKLISAMRPDVATGVLFMMDHSFAVVTLEKTAGGKGTVRSAECPATGIWNPSPVVVKPLEEECFKSIEKIWQTELSKVRYAKRQRAVTGGMGYHFFSFSKGNSLSGIADSVGHPEELPALDNLLNLANLLGAYAKCDQSSEAEILNHLKKRIDKQLEFESREP